MARKIALVTGAGTGIGRAAASALVHDGWDTIFVGRRMEKLEEAVADAATLTVVTLAGQVTASYDRVKGWTVAPGSNPQVIASTEIRIDGDIATIVPVDGNKPDADWLALHERSVTAAAEARAALIKSVAELLKAFV